MMVIKRRIVKNIEIYLNYAILIIEMQFITTEKADKNTLIPLLIKILCNENRAYDFDRIQQLLDSLADDISFTIEYPYIDAHYRDSFYFYYAARFSGVERNTIRVHIISVRSDTETDSEQYLGYFIIRPLSRFPLGHSFISPRAFRQNNFICCLTQQRISFLGRRYTIDAFPHVVQDTETQTCAESSIWSLLSYFGSKYKDYKPIQPSEIIKRLDSFAGHRMLPSKGLSLHELSVCLNSCGQNCMVYCLKDDPETRVFDYAVMRIYIESGMPFIVLLGCPAAGHAVLAIGHENITVENVSAFFQSDSSIWNDVSFFDKRLIFTDDNFPQYQTACCGSPADRYSGVLQQMQIQAFIVPLQRHMYMDAQNAFSVMKLILDDKEFGLEKFAPKWITRLLLTNSSSFKCSLYSDTVISEKMKDFLLYLSLPKFVWICELYTGESYKKNICEGILILDPTGSKSFESIIVYIVKDSLIENDGLSLYRKCSIISFEKQPYRNNLKGAWNNWKS